jgi:DNA invertase Pin-like site-specific DNA recombinase
MTRRRELTDRAAAGDVDALVELGRLDLARKKPGPKPKPVDMARVDELSASGKKVIEAAAEQGVSESTIYRRKRAREASA